MIFNPVVYDLFKDAIAAMKVEGFDSINFEAGSDYQVIKSLIQKDNAPSLQALKYPVVAVLMPITEIYGNNYPRIRVNRIIIAHLTNQDIDVSQLSDASEVFKTVLYPCYYEFMKQLAFSRYVVGQDQYAITHAKFDNPSRQPIGEGLQDYVDTIEIGGLELVLNQIKTCKSNGSYSKSVLVSSKC